MLAEALGTRTWRGEMGWGSGTVKSKALGRGAGETLPQGSLIKMVIRGMGLFMTGLKAGCKRKAEGQTVLLSEATREGASFVSPPTSSSN